MPVVHCMKKPYDVYIGRPSKWGNPFSHLDVDEKFKTPTREEAIRLYREYMLWKLEQEPSLVAELAELDGKTLGCWCAPKACHGDILLELAKEVNKLIKPDTVEP